MTKAEKIQQAIYDTCSFRVKHVTKDKEEAYKRLLIRKLKKYPKNLQRSIRETLISMIHANML